MKKKLFKISAIAAVAMMTLCSCAATTTQSGSSNASGAESGFGMWGMILLWAAVFAAFYFFMIRPNSKRKKQEQEMRNNLEIGDEVTTIGGIVGRVVSIKEETDSFVLETGADKCKIQFKRWAISTVDTIKDEPAKTEQTEKRGLFGRRKKADADSEEKKS